MSARQPPTAPVAPGTGTGGAGPARGERLRARAAAAHRSRFASFLREMTVSAVRAGWVGRPRRIDPQYRSILSGSLAWRQVSRRSRNPVRQLAIEGMKPSASRALRLETARCRAIR